jgi:hypothetical protein
VETPPPRSVQTSIEWSRTVAAATTTPDLIVDLAVGHSWFLAEAIERGARVICPGDGAGGAHLQETLMRTIGAADLGAPAGDGRDRGDDHRRRYDADHLG